MIKEKGDLSEMFKILCWLLLDGFFLFGLLSFGDEMRGEIILFIAAIAFFTWELICAFKQWLK